MKIPITALLDRSLRLEMRSPLMAIVRVALPGLILLELMGIEKMSRFGVFSAPGLHIFTSIAWTLFTFLTLAAIGYFSAVVTEEKEEMTLGLLRMTDLSPVAILLGKSTGRLLGAILLLVIALPFTLLAVALGGISTTQIFAAYTILLAYLVFVTNIALFWSVVGQRTIHASILTLLTLFALLAIPPILRDSFPWTGFMARVPPSIQDGIQGIMEWGYNVSPITGLIDSLSVGSTQPILSLSALNCLGGGLLFFLSAWAVFDACTRDQKDASPRRILFRFRGLSRGCVPQSLAGPRVIAWKDHVFMGGGQIGTILKLVLVGGICLLIGFISAYSEERPGVTFDFKTSAVCFVWIPLAIAALHLAVDAGRVFSEEARWKTLTSLMTLPLSTRELFRLKVRRMLCSAASVLWLMLAALVLAPDIVAEGAHDLWEVLDDALPYLLCGLSTYVAFLYLTACLSLVVKRGAMFLAGTIVYFGTSVLTIFLMNCYKPTITITVIAVFTIIGLHHWLIALLEQAAARE